VELTKIKEMKFNWATGGELGENKDRGSFKTG